jgi:hypothetical protein
MKTLMSYCINSLSVLLVMFSLMAWGEMDHSHMPIAVPESVKPVALSLVLTKDAMSGFNLTLHTQHYNLIPPRQGLSMAESMAASINAESGYIEGHAHLYINGEKIQRIYGRNIHLPETLFKQGTHSISVTLNNHGHMAWTQDDKKIVSTLYIDDLESGAIKHTFESFPVRGTD